MVNFRPVAMLCLRPTRGAQAERASDKDPLTIADGAKQRIFVPESGRLAVINDGRPFGQERRAEESQHNQHPNAFESCHGNSSEPPRQTGWWPHEMPSARSGAKNCSPERQSVRKKRDPLFVL